VSPSPEPRAYPRILGRHDSGRPGPTIVVFGGVHGNEPAGCEAMLRVLARITREGFAPGSDSRSRTAVDSCVRVRIEHFLESVTGQHAAPRFDLIEGF